MASNDIWFPFYPSDYLRDTMRLTTEQHGAYLLLLFSFWIDKGEMPDDDVQFAAITRLPLDYWKNSMRPVMERFFVISGGVWMHKRVKAERVKCDTIRQVRSDAGKLGGRPSKQNKSKTESNQEAKTKQIESISPSQSQSHSEPESESESPKTNVELERECPLLGDESPPSTAVVILRYLNQKANRDYREIPTHLDEIRQRLKEPGVNLEGVKLMIDRQVASWKGTSQEPYLRPSTLFNKTKFASYYDNRSLPVQPASANGQAGQPGVRPDYSKGF